MSSSEDPLPSARQGGPRYSFTLANLSVLAKLRLLALPGIAATLLLAGWHASEGYERGYRAHEHTSRSAVEAASGVIKWAYEQEQLGAMTRQQAQQSALSAVRQMRYSGVEYFWINDMHPTVLMHPIKPELDGKDASGIKDPNGKALFVAFADMVRQHGSGFVPYLWPKPGSSEPVPKLSYVQGFAPWGWVVGSGIYIDDLRSELASDLSQVGLGVLVLVVALFALTQLLSRSLIADLRRVTEIAQRVSRGDLSQDVFPSTRDEIGMLVSTMGEMTQTLRVLVNDVQQSAHAVEACAVEIANDNGSVSQRTQQQAAALEETAATMEQLTATIRQNADSTRHASELAVTASDIAAESGRSVGQVVATMSAIGESSRKINDIVGLVHDIALQTNILALNAEIEAARAGEHGRGFAAVASEVRNLAERSAAAAKDINGLIGVTVEQVGRGNQLVNSAAGGMQALVASVAKLTQVVAQISAATAEQSTGVGQAGQAIAEIDRATQHNADLVATTSAKAESLSEQATQLVNAVVRFSLDKRTAQAPQTVPRAPLGHQRAHRSVGRVAATQRRR